tara:strand:- start:173 stop:685 length:513 start_codon:yes stop_codon:yes gene_type:complete
MNKMISKLLVSLAVVCGFGMNAQAGELAKSGEYSGTGFYSGKVLGMVMKGKAPALIQAVYYGGSKNSAGSGFFHLGSYKCNFTLEIIEMPQTESMGFCTFVDADGDTALQRATIKGNFGGPSKGVAKFVHGTGKYEGITGDSVWNISPLPSAEQGTFQGWNEFSGTYQIP